MLDILQTIISLIVGLLSIYLIFYIRKKAEVAAEYHKEKTKVRDEEKSELGKRILNFIMTDPNQILETDQQTLFKDISRISTFDKELAKSLERYFVTKLIIFWDTSAKVKRNATESRRISIENREHRMILEKKANQLLGSLK